MNHIFGSPAPRPVARKFALSCAAVLVLTAGAALWAVSAPSARTQPASPDRARYLQAGRKSPLEKVKWEKVFSLMFDDAGELSRFTQAAGQWEIRDGKLWAAAGEKNRTILLAHVSGPTLRIEFEATSFADAAGALGDITVLLNASPGKSATANGYALTTGSYMNTCTTFYRQGRKLARTEYSPVVSGKINRMAIEFDRGHIRYWMNDEILLECWDENPLPIDGSLWMGVRTWATRMAIDNLTVYKPG